MRILINAANLQKGGALQVAVSLLTEFANYSEHQFHIFAAKPLLDAAAEQLAESRFSATIVDRSPTHGLLAWRQFLRTAQQVEETWKPDAALTVFGPGLWRPRVPHLMGFANGLYLFSNSRFIREDWPISTAARIRYFVRRRLLLQRVRKEADSWWVETKTARQELAHAAVIANVRIAVVPNALGPSFLPFLREPVSKEPDGGYNQPFRVLVMGAAYPNKNLELVSQTLTKLHDVSIEFHFTLPQSDFESVFVEHLGDERIKNLGPLIPRDAPNAYLNVDAVMLPSKLETFSAVLLEAAAMQKPLLVSDLPFAREVCGDSAQFFDPWDAASVVAALRAVMGDRSLREKLVRAGYARIQAAPTAVYRAQCILDNLAALVHKA